MILDKKGLLAPDDDPCFHISPRIISELEEYEGFNAAQIKISLYDDGCNQAATVSKHTTKGKIDYFYRFCCREFYVDVGDDEDLKGTREKFKNLDDLVCAIFRFTRPQKPPVWGSRR